MRWSAASADCQLPRCSSSVSSAGYRGDARGFHASANHGIHRRVKSWFPDCGRATMLVVDGRSRCITGGTHGSAIKTPRSKSEQCGNSEYRRSFGCLPCDRAVNAGDQVSPGRQFVINDTAPTEIYTLSLHDALPEPVVTIR